MPNCQLTMFLFALACGALSAEAQEPAPTATTTPCDCAKSEAAATSRDGCFCLDEELYSYPVPGGIEAVYRAYQYEDCNEYSCSGPIEVPFYGPSGAFCPEICPDDCNARRLQQGKVRGPLERPAPAGYRVPLHPPLRRIAQEIHQQYIAFNAPGLGWIRATVFLIKLPEDAAVRPGLPARMLAMGVEVESNDQTLPTAEIDRRFVKQLDAYPFHFQVRMGGVTYDVATAPRTERQPAADATSEGPAADAAASTVDGGSAPAAADPPQ